MISITHAIPLPVAIPLILAALLAFLGHFLSRRVIDVIAIATAALATLLCARILAASLPAPLVYWFGNWWPRNGFALGEDFFIDPIAASFALLAALLTFLALVFSWKYFQHSGNHFQPLMLIFMAAMCGFCYAGDLFNLFVFFELMSATAFALCGLKTAEPAPLQGSFNFAITNTIGAFLVLTGLALLYARTGALNMANIGRSLSHPPHADALILLSFLFIAVGYLVKGAIFPFHLWLPDAHAVAPTPVCMLFSGIMVELGIYAVARIYWTIYQAPLAFHTRELRLILVSLGALSALVGAVMCYSQHHLKRLLAFSTVSHAGLMLIAVGLLHPLAISGFALYVLGHGCTKAGLFAAAGIVLHRLQHIGEQRLHGRGRDLIFTPLLFILGALALAALPPALLLTGEASTTEAAQLFRFAWTKWIFFACGILTAAAVLRFTFRAFYGWGIPAPLDEASMVGEKPETEHQHRTVHAVLFVPAALLILAGFAITFVPHLQQYANSAAALFTDQQAYHSQVLDSAAVALPPLEPTATAMSSIVRGLLAAALALLLSLATIFRGRLPFSALFAALEHGFPPLRAMHSGHPGDYVAWLTFGTAVLGGAFALLLR